MSSSKFEVKKFNSENDFILWRIKMKALMVDQCTSASLDLKAQTEIEDKKLLAEIMSKAYSVLIISLGDEVLREVSEEASALAIWEKLESIYMNKSLANRLYLKNNCIPCK